MCWTETKLSALNLREVRVAMLKKVAAIDSITKVVQVNHPYQLPVLASLASFPVDAGGRLPVHDRSA